MPQWNCSCENCNLARQGAIHPRTQSSAAVSADGKHWFLINASPDLRAQIEAFPPIQPTSATARNTPIEAVLVTNADLDHVLGLFLLREAGKLRVLAPRAVLSVLEKDLHLFDTLKPFCEIDTDEPPEKKLMPLTLRNGNKSGLSYCAIPLAAKAPPFSRKPPKGTQSVAYEIVDDASGHRLLAAPDVAEISPQLLKALSHANVILFDGTFWSNHEFQKLTGRKRSAADMGHIPIHGGSLKILRKLKARHKVYFHINNTNPVLRADSPERVRIERAGLTVGTDGMELEL